MTALREQLSADTITATVSPRLLGEDLAISDYTFTPFAAQDKVGVMALADGDTDVESDTQMTASDMPVRLKTKGGRTMAVMSHDHYNTLITEVDELRQRTATSGEEQDVVKFAPKRKSFVTATLQHRAHRPFKIVQDDTDDNEL